ncbi:MAG: HAD-IA family hydrolase [Casimicrobium sp.]
MQNTPQKYDVILFDLLTALLDSWSVWNRAAGTEADGRRWRARYLELTYGCGAYRPYELLVAQAAEDIGLPRLLENKLEGQWLTLTAWPLVSETLRALAKTHRLGIVTNCSDRLGKQAASLLGIAFDTVVTSETAGFYKPHPAPYEKALATLGVRPERALFVAGSAYDLIGTSRVGLPTVWHNAIGLPMPQAVTDAKVTPPLAEFRAFNELMRWA